MPPQAPGGPAPAPPRPAPTSHGMSASKPYAASKPLDWLHLTSLLVGDTDRTEIACTSQWGSPRRSDIVLHIARTRAGPSTSPARTSPPLGRQPARAYPRLPPHPFTPHQTHTYLSHLFELRRQYASDNSDALLENSSLRTPKVLLMTYSSSVMTRRLCSLLLLRRRT